MSRGTAEQLLQKFSDFLEASSNLDPGGQRHLLRILTGLPDETIAALLALYGDVFSADEWTRLLLLGAWLASSESKAATA
jgi:hypothetical protein